MNPVEKVLSVIDDKTERYFSKKWHWAITIPVVIAILVLAYFIFCFSKEPYTTYGYRSDASRTVARCVAGVLIVLCFVYVFLEAATRRLTGEKAVRSFLVIASTILTLWGFQNALNTGAHHHDSGSFGTGNHWSIIYDIFSTGKIPDVNLHNQYYQPKFYHMVIAGLMHFNMLFIRLGDGSATSNETTQAKFPDYTISAYQSLEFTRVFMIILGIISLYALYRIVKGLGFQGKKMAIITSLLFFIPEFYYIQFFLNNDGLALTLSLVSFALALAFAKQEKIVPLIFAAVFLGLAMMTKLNAALMAIPMAAIFVYVFIRKIIRKENVGVLIGKFAIFAVIVFPLGLWTPILYKIKYDMPIGYVLDLTPTYESKVKYGMYIDPTFYNFFQRCIAFPNEDLFYTPFNIRWRHKVDGVYVNEYHVIDFNCWTAFFKTSMFDEWSDFANRNGLFATGLLVIGLYLEVLLVLLGVFMGIYYVMRYLIKKQYKQGCLKQIVLLVTLMTYVINYIVFVNKYPVGCSQNARYIMPIWIPIQTIVGSMISDAHDGLLRLRKRSETQSA